MLSAKSILINNTLTNGEEKPKKRGATIEFQGYAHKLATDLNDLDHINIYMMLSKKVERQLMEQAYSYVADSNSEQKGRLFLWKLKKIREQVERDRNKKNFTYDYVLSRQKEFKKIFAKEIILKQDSEINDEIIESIKKYILNNRRILMIGNTSRRMLKLLENYKPKASVIELSPDINRVAKSSNLKIINKDFLKNNYKDNYFDVVIINNYWNQIPFEAEIKFLKEIKRVSKPTTIFLVLSKDNSKETEMWKELENRKQIYLCYVKTFSNKYLIEQFEKFELKLEKNYSINNNNLSVFISAV